MQMRGDDITLTCLLHAISHFGESNRFMVGEAMELYANYLKLLETPKNVKICGAMVDVLIRCRDEGECVGKDEMASAIEIVESFVENDGKEVLWMSLLNGCEDPRDYELGERICEKILDLSGGYGFDSILKMANIYEKNGDIALAKATRKRISF